MSEPIFVFGSKLTALCEAQNWRCCYCGIRCDGPRDADDSPTTEHIIPKNVGGKAHWINEVMACKLCNNARGSMRWSRFLQIVQWKGREKAARYARRRRHRVNLDRWRKQREALVADLNRHAPLPSLSDKEEGR